MKKTLKDLITNKEHMLDSAHCASFMQRVKMAVWKLEEAPHIPESILDEILLLAWEDIKNNETI